MSKRPAQPTRDSDRRYSPVEDVWEPVASMHMPRMCPRAFFSDPKVNFDSARNQITVMIKPLENTSQEILHYITDQNEPVGHQE